MPAWTHTGAETSSSSPALATLRALLYEEFGEETYACMNAIEVYERRLAAGRSRPQPSAIEPPLLELGRAVLRCMALPSAPHPSLLREGGRRPAPGARKQAIPNKLRWRVFKRDAFRCCRCGSQDDLTLDHIVPECKGGQMTLENLQTLCRSCNSRKGGRG